MYKSPVSFFRRQLGFRGNSVHSGRGYYDFFITDDVSVDDILAKVAARANAWSNRGILESKEDTATMLSVVVKSDVFVPNHFGFPQSYRRLIVNKQLGNVLIVME